MRQRLAPLLAVFALLTVAATPMSPHGCGYEYDEPTPTLPPTLTPVPPTPIPTATPTKPESLAIGAHQAQRNTLSIERLQAVPRWLAVRIATKALYDAVGYDPNHRYGPWGGVMTHEETWPKTYFGGRPEAENPGLAWLIVFQQGGGLYAIITDADGCGGSTLFKMDPRLNFDTATLEDLSQHFVPHPQYTGEIICP